jgi:hypothetical protein
LSHANETISLIYSLQQTKASAPSSLSPSRQTTTNSQQVTQTQDFGIFSLSHFQQSEIPHKQGNRARISELPSPKVSHEAKQQQPQSHHFSQPMRKHAKPYMS